MAVIVDELPHTAFTMLRNCWLRDRRISYKAKGLLGYLRSHAAGYKCSQAQMVRESDDGRAAVRAALDELEAAGYLVRVRTRAEGRYAETDYRMRDPFDDAGNLRVIDTPAAADVQIIDQGRKSHTATRGENQTLKIAPLEEHLEKINPAANAAGATSDNGAGALDETPTPQQQARALAREHHEAVGGMAPYMGVVKIVERALTVVDDTGAPRYRPDRVSAALRVLREAGRPVTLQTLHAALETPQAVGARRAGPYRDPDPADYGAF